MVIDMVLLIMVEEAGTTTTGVALVSLITGVLEPHLVVAMVWGSIGLIVRGWLLGLLPCMETMLLLML